MEEKKKIKRVNFLKEEKQDLLKLIKKYPATVSKQTDNKGIASKRRAWQELTLEFNRMSGHVIERTEDQLRKLWENTKHEYKRKLSEQKKQVFETGGGVIKSSFTEDPSMEVILNTTDIELRSAVDSDTVALMKTAAEVPHTAFSEVPHTSSEVPQTSSEVPQTSSEVPQTSSEVPQTSPEVPQTSSEVPHTSFEVPHNYSENLEIVFLNESEYNVRDELLAEEEEIDRLEQEIRLTERAAQRSAGNQIGNTLKRNKQKPPKSREAIVQDLVDEKKRLMQVEHQWKEAEHHFRAEVLLAKKEAFVAKKEAYNAKKKYYSAKILDSMIHTFSSSRPTVGFYMADI